MYEKEWGVTKGEVWAEQNRQDGKISFIGKNREVPQI